MEVIVKARLLLTSVLFLFAQSPTTQAQETLDLAKITCDQFEMRKLNTPARDIVLILTGYYHGMRKDTIIDPQITEKHLEQLNSYCNAHGGNLMDAIKSVLGLDK
jgi:HdeA/HdeB family